MREVVRNVRGLYVVAAQVDSARKAREAARGRPTVE